MAESGKSSAGQRTPKGGGGDGVRQEPRLKKQKPRRGVGELNLASMLDVTFLLLIFFVLTAKFIIGEGILPADLPQGQGEGVSEAEPPDQIDIVLQSLGGEDVRVQFGGALQSEGTVASFVELREVLRRYQQSESNPNGFFLPEDPIIIKPGSSVNWGHVVNAFNACIGARYSNVNFAKAQGD